MEKYSQQKRNKKENVYENKTVPRSGENAKKNLTKETETGYQIEEEGNVYESVDGVSLPQRENTEQEKPPQMTKRVENECQKKIIVSLIVITIVFCAAIVTLLVMMFRITSKLEDFETRGLDIFKEQNLSLQETRVFSLQTANGLNGLNISFQDTVKKEKDRAAVTMCKGSSTQYSSGDVIPFKNIRTVNGISNSGLSSIRNTGKFTCESSGLYLISVFILTKINKSSVTLYKDNQQIAYSYFSVNDNWFQTSTVIVLEKLSVNDTIYVKAASTIYVYYGVHSCMSVLQIN